MATAGRLTASIAHEINNPLQAVQNCLHLAGRKELSEEQRQKYLDMARTELERLMNTVQRMLDFYRPAALDRKPIDINKLLESVLSLVSPQLKDHNILIYLDLSPGLPHVLVVADQIQQVFLNLLLNALEAMPRGGDLFIQTSIGGTPSSQHEIEVIIEDSGPGVPPSERKHIFEPFVSTKEKGTGLGLAVSYGIVTAHGGSLELVDGRSLTSRHPGLASTDKHRTEGARSGACFRVSLPIVEHT
jgi:two-component system NtrC family sensor kinase